MGPTSICAPDRTHYRNRIPRKRFLFFAQAAIFPPPFPPRPRTDERLEAGRRPGGRTAKFMKMLRRAPSHSKSTAFARYVSSH